MIKYQVGNVLYNYDKWKFPAGEVGIRLPAHACHMEVPQVTIKAALNNSDEVMELFMVTDAIHRQFPLAKVNLMLGYVPYGRQDRKCVDGESLSLSVFCKLINAQEYERVIVIDPHSDVTPALIDRCEVMSQTEVFAACFKQHFGTVSNQSRVIVAPDAGAAKKASEIAEKFGFADVVYCVKKRDLQTGKIVDLSLSGSVNGRPVVVVDDICDGGATFIQLANLLAKENVAQKQLIITHGIFSKGHEALTSCYDGVYTTNTFHMEREGNVDGVVYTKLI